MPPGLGGEARTTTMWPAPGAAVAVAVAGAAPPMPPPAAAAGSRGARAWSIDRVVSCRVWCAATTAIEERWLDAPDRGRNGGTDDACLEKKIWGMGCQSSGRECACGALANSIGWLGQGGTLARLKSLGAAAALDDASMGLALTGPKIWTPAAFTTLQRSTVVTRLTYRHRTTLYTRQPASQGSRQSAGSSQPAGARISQSRGGGA